MLEDYCFVKGITCKGGKLDTYLRKLVRKVLEMALFLLTAYSKLREDKNELKIKMLRSEDRNLKI